MALHGHRKGTWEVPDEEWERVRQQVRDAAENAARQQQVVSYSVVADQAEYITDGHSHALAEMLGEIQRECFESGRALLPAVVTYLHNPNDVGTGFFDMARHLGYDVGRNKPSRETFWLRQVRLVFDEYASKQ